MPGRPVKVDHIREEFLRALSSADSIVEAVVQLEGFNPQVARILHPKHVRRVVELAFLGAVAAWEEFVENSFVRYLAGAKCSNGFAPTLRLGAARSLSHAYHVISGNPDYDPSSDYLKFSEASWTIRTSKIYFDEGRPFAPHLSAKLDRIKDAAKLRNRVAHASTKCREDFRNVAVAFLQPASGALTQGYRVGDLLLSPAIRHFGPHVHNQNYYSAFIAMFRALAVQIVP